MAYFSFFYPDTSFAINHNMENKVLEDKSVEHFAHEYIQMNLGESIDIEKYINQKFLVSSQKNPDDFYITYQVPELENPFLE